MKDTYLFKRLSEIGSPEKLVKFNALNQEGKKQELTLFSSDEHDNLNIHYNMLIGHPWNMRKEGTRDKPKPYIRTRIKNPSDAKVKYISPKGLGLLPFFTPSLIEKYQNGTEIFALFLIEGEMKALAGSVNGIDAVGLGSIHGFYAEKDEDDTTKKHRLADEIIEVIRKCKVKKLIYLTDADTLVLNYSPDKDLAKRPHSFYSATKNFREAAKVLIYDNSNELQDFYFMHIKTEFCPDSKGLDELLFNNKKEKKAIVDDINRLEQAYAYFNCYNLKTFQETHLKEYFGLKDVINFYETYSEVLQGKEFEFRQIVYYYDEADTIMRTVKNKALDDYLRIGTKYLRRGAKTVYFEGFEMKVPLLKPWEKVAINEDHGKGSSLRVKKYFDFVNDPNWLNHRQAIDGNYNVCHPIGYVWKKGSVEHSLKLVSHLAINDNFYSIDEKTKEIFENPEIGNVGTMLLDYLSIMIQFPKHQLPIPCFLSKEQETGKTTFAALVQKIFEGNSIIIQTRDFTGQFNSHFAGKFFVAIDEGNFIQKVIAKEQIKYVSTTPDISVNEKGIAQYSVTNYSKIMICSNSEEDFLIIDKNDKRFWIHKVKTITEKDPDFVSKLFKEIPAFFYFLANREIFHPRKTRNWFDERLIMNEIWLGFVHSSKQAWKAEIDEAFIHLFETWQDIETVRMTVGIIMYNLSSINHKTNISMKQIKQYLKVDLALTPLPQERHSTYKLASLGGVYEVVSDNGRPYEISRELFTYD
jgi:hypothetical protein